MLDHPKNPKSYYLKQLQQLAKIAQYQPTASIPQPNNDFNYTIAKHRYNQYQHTRIRSKPSPQPSLDKNQLKLTTILQTSSPHNLFPKINHRRRQYAVESSQNKSFSPKRVYNKLRSHFTRQTTSMSVDKSLTIDTRLETQSELGMISLLDSRKSQRAPVSSFNLNTPPIMQSSVFQSLKQQEESSDDEQYQKDAVPGPGSYTYSSSDFDKTHSKCSTAVTFLSKSTRFPIGQPFNPPVPQTTLPAVQQQKSPKKLLMPKKLAPFGSRSPRRYQFQQKSKEIVPGPQHYNPRCGIQQDLIRRIQRNFKGSFGSNIDRFAEQSSGQNQLGPGVYYKEPQANVLQNQGSIFKSASKRFQ